MRGSDRQIFRLILAMVLIAGCWFYHRGAWAQASRLGAIYAFCEPVSPDYGRFTIDRFIDSAAPEKNGDWAYCDGHFYSNKAPGSFLPGIAVYLPLFPLLRGWFGYPFPEPVRIFVEILLNFVCSGLWTALGAAWFYRLLRQLQCSQRRSALFALAFAFATPMIAYSTMLWGHPMAAACTVFALYNLARGERRSIFWSGFWIGNAVLTDYMCAAFLPVFPFLLYRAGNRRRWPEWIAGGSLPAIVFGAYHWWCFGTPFTLATLWNNPVFLDPEAAAGISTGFSLAVLLKLLFSTRFGWLIQMPVMLHPLQLLKRHDPPRLPVSWLAAALWSVTAALCINAAFNGWHGGATACARYLIPTVPFWMLLTAAVPFRSTISRLCLGISLTVSMINMAAITMTMPLFFHFYALDYLLQPPLMQKSWCYHPLRAAGLPPIASWGLLILLLMPLCRGLWLRLRLTEWCRRIPQMPWRSAAQWAAIPALWLLLWFMAERASYDRCDAALTAAALAADRADVLPSLPVFPIWLTGLLTHDPVLHLTWLATLAAMIFLWGLRRLAQLSGIRQLPWLLPVLLPGICSFSGIGWYLLTGGGLLLLTMLPRPIPDKCWKPAAVIIIVIGLWGFLRQTSTPTLGEQYHLARETATLRQHYPVANGIAFYQDSPAIYDHLCDLAIHNGDAMRYQLPGAASGWLQLRTAPSGKMVYSLELTATK